MQTRNHLFSLFVFLVAVPVGAAVYLGGVGLERERGMLVEREREALAGVAFSVRDGFVRELQRLHRRESARDWSDWLPGAGSPLSDNDRRAPVHDWFLVAGGKPSVPWGSRAEIPRDVAALAASPPALPGGAARAWLAGSGRAEELLRGLGVGVAATGGGRVRVVAGPYGWSGDLAVRRVQVGDGPSLLQGFRVDVERLEQRYLDADASAGVVPRGDERFRGARVVAEEARLRATPERGPRGLPRRLHLTLASGDDEPDPVLMPPGHVLAVDLRPSPAFERDLAAAADRLWWTLGVVAFVTVLGLLFAWRAVRAESRLAERKAEFVSAVSHELRTPLTSIRMYADLLQEGWVKDSDTARDYFGLISAESERLARLVNNVLDFSRIEKGRKSFDMQLGDPAGTVREAGEILRPYLRDQEFELVLDVPETLPACRFDKDALMQILVNLIDNAVKYGEREVRIEAETRDGHLVLRVLDRGPGVPASERARIFEPFTRGAAADRRGGSGLGLALVRHYVDEHRGTIEVAEREGGGAVFALSLPLGA